VLYEAYEPGIPIADVRRLFATVRDAIRPLIAKLPKQPDRPVMHSHLPAERQLAAHRELARMAGYDFTKGRLDTSTHPFSAAFGRITTRFTDSTGHGFLSTLHEAGHALYEHQCVEQNPEWIGTPFARYRSLAVHESQSRLWENHIGRGEDFWVFAYPRMQAAYAPELDGVTLTAFLALLNTPKTDFIRVNADELTYCMHVFLRFEIEQDVIGGKITVNDIPRVWNQKMHEYLGITPKDDAQGCLQDMHWSGGSIGYFPTYALGSIIAAQMHVAIAHAIPDLAGQLRRGDTIALRAWLRDNVHAHACRYPTGELIRRATGRPLSPDDYIAYLRSKYGVTRHS
jgi:carboxypeptidase Taq